MQAIFSKNRADRGAKRLLKIAGLLFINLGIVGCSDNKQSSDAAPLGKIVLKGSNTIGEELAPRLIAEYKRSHPTAALDLESKATGYGLAALMAGRCDIAAASRTPIKEETELAQGRGIEFKDYIIGSYSVAVVVNAANPIVSLSKDQVRDIFTGSVQNWKDVGGPDGLIHLYVRDPISGTYLGFKELAMENKAYAAGLKTFTNYLSIVEAVASDPSAIGYSSIRLASRAGVKPVTIGGIVPTTASVNEGKYPYARTLRFYTDKARETQSAAEFVKFVLSSQGQEILAQMGFVPRM
jgi:phosphate transport system substrate-binding protein